MAACKVQNYKPRTNKIKSKFTNKTNYVYNEHCNIVIERFKVRQRDSKKDRKIER